MMICVLDQNLLCTRESTAFTCRQFTITVANVSLPLEEDHNITVPPNTLQRITCSINSPEITMLGHEFIPQGAVIRKDWNYICATEDRSRKYALSFFLRNSTVLMITSLNDTSGNDGDTLTINILVEGIM